jgi:hypothetical protein
LRSIIACRGYGYHCANVAAVAVPLNATGAMVCGICRKCAKRAAKNGSTGTQLK